MSKGIQEQRGVGLGPNVQGKAKGDQGAALVVVEMLVQCQWRLFEVVEVEACIEGNGMACFYRGLLNSAWSLEFSISVAQKALCRQAAN